MFHSRMEITEVQYQRIAPIPSSATWQCQPVEPASAQRNPVCGRARLQVAGIAASLWQLAHGLYPDEPVVEERGARPSIRISATRADSAYQARSGFDGQHRRQGPSRWYGCVKKKRTPVHRQVPSGWTTKIHMVAADARTAVTFSLSPDRPTTHRRGGSCWDAWVAGPEPVPVNRPRIPGE